MAIFAVVSNGTVENIAEAESLTVLQLLLPEKEIMAETTETGFAWIGADVINGKFKAPQVYASWTYDVATNTWQAPTPQPDFPSYWDEATLSWIEITLPTEEPNA